MIQFIFDLYPKTGILPRHIPYGHKFRGVIMQWLLESNPDLGDTFHSHDEIRPYAINTIPHKKEGKIEFILTSYSDDFSDTIIHDVLQSEKVNFIIDNQQFFIARITFERLNPEQLKQHAQPVNKFQIHFVTPIYFNTFWGDYPVRFPLPNLFFGNLVNIWNDINENKEHSKTEREPLLEWINTHLYISGYKMRTAKRNIGKGRPLAGGIGNITYRISKINTSYYEELLKTMNKTYDHAYVNEHYLEACCWIDILSKLGTYTNAGGNRTAGMGVIRYFPKSYLSKQDLLSKVS